jgi:hypothetical protein
MFGKTTSKMVLVLFIVSAISLSLGSLANRQSASTADEVLDETGSLNQPPYQAAAIQSSGLGYGGTVEDLAYSVIQTDDEGYALAGYTNSYGAGGYDFYLVKIDPNCNMQWNKTYGGTSYETAYSVVQTADGGYALAGGTPSYGAGSADFWLVKTDSAGNAQWNKTYGGADSDLAHSMVQTGDGGYALAGYTRSFGAGSYDFWLVKTDSNGNMEWNKTYGGAGDDFAWSMVQTGDGGYAIVGETISYGAGSWDFWLIKTDPTGNAQWNKTYGGTSAEYARSVVQTGDGGYAITGWTGSISAGYDCWLVKTDSAGSAQWNKTYGGTSEDYAYSVVQTDDGRYAIAGETQSYGAGSADFWLVETDSNGNAQWNQTYGGTNSEGAYSMVQTRDGGYAMAGYTYSYERKTDLWFVKTDSHGNLQWNQTFGGTKWDELNSVIQTVDGGYALVGSTYSYGAGAADFWLVKTDSAGNAEWNKTYGGRYHDWASALVQTGDGGYAVVGYTGSFGAGNDDIWLVKTDAYGNMQWNATYGGTNWDRAYSVVRTGDGGYAIAGYTLSYGAGGADFWLVKIDSAGNAQWNKTYGGTSDDRARSMWQTSEGGFALAGDTGSFPPGGYDFWLVKTDAYGNMLWNKDYGGAESEFASSVVQTVDGGYVMAGYTLPLNVSFYDSWLVKTDLNGNAQWNKTYGGISNDCARCVIQTVDGGYAMAGYTESYGAGTGDFWLVKTDASGNAQWNKTYGGTGYDEAHSMLQTVDGGYAVAGLTESFGAGSFDFWFVKTDEYGIISEVPCVFLPALMTTTLLAMIIHKRKPQRKLT